MPPRKVGLVRPPMNEADGIDGSDGSRLDLWPAPASSIDDRGHVAPVNSACVQQSASHRTAPKPSKPSMIDDALLLPLTPEHSMCRTDWVVSEMVRHRER